MAKKQNKNAKKRQKAKQTAPQPKKPTVSPIKGKREPSKGEIKFFRIGVAIIALGLVVAAIVIIVNNYMTQEEVNPYEDYNHLQTEELAAITKYVNNTTYGDLDYFTGKSQYADLRVILNQYDVFYFYFYHSSDINEDIKAEIDAMEDIVDSALLFIDLDAYENITLLEDANLTHLSLSADANDMLLIYDVQPESIDDFFTLETEAADIIDQLGNL
ncbi:MAG: hypothetical protein K8Q99_07965 [Acholeplasmataceae bacterium]|nr:hypothetical protein [Acholeplasmataceae bacterium]